MVFKVPSPLNVMVEGNHWDQWFSNGFGARQPLVTMVFDGFAPLVRRWNGYVPSLKSREDYGEILVDFLGDLRAIFYDNR